MKRRDFYSNIARMGAVAALGMGMTKTAQATSTTNPEEDPNKKRKFPKRIICPPRLKIGANVGLVAPSSPISLSKWHQTIKNLENLGFNLIYDEKKILTQNGYLAGSDAQRASEINRMFADKNIDGIWCVRGGYGAMRILDLLDYKIIKKNPKILVGFSDVTALLHAIFLKTGLVGFHGPVGASTFSDYTTKHTSGLLMSPAKAYEIELAADHRSKTDSEFKPVIIQGGTATGKLVGGNLTLLASLMGTPYEIELKNKLVFLEDVGEKPYRIDRMLTQLLLAGELQQAAGIVLGVFSGCETKPDVQSFSLIEMLKDRLGGLGMPVLYGFSFGHIDNNCTLPLGIEATLDVNQMKITFKESAVCL